LLNFLADRVEEARALRESEHLKDQETVIEGE
jgi:hypothetical protein